jgi:hypothetical protein
MISMFVLEADIYELEGVSCRLPTDTVSVVEVTQRHTNTVNVGVIFACPYRT